MKLTLDHNVIIDFATHSPRIAHLRDMINEGSHQTYIVEIGASEMRQRGIKPDRYDLFEQLLVQAGLQALSRLAPMGRWGVTFWGHMLWADKDMARKAKQIETILFGESKTIDVDTESETSSKAAARLNRVCDILSMWCHLHYQNDIFVTSDSNFHKVTKIPRLLALGAGRIARPEEL